MNRFAKCAALGLALILSSTAIFGCQSKVDYTEKLEFLTEVSDKALNIAEGEILIVETRAVEKEIEGVAQDVKIETSVLFWGGPDNPDFELKRTESYSTTGVYNKYTFVKSNDQMLELFNGVGTNEVTEAPDIFEAFEIDFGTDEISELEVIDVEKLNDCYALTMTDDYVNKFDTEVDGAKFDCTSVVISYYIDSLDRLTKRTCEITYTLTVNGESQTVTTFIESQIA